MTHYFRCNIVLQESGPDHSLHGRQRDARTSNRDVGSDMIKLRHGCIRANDGRTSEFPRISDNRPCILPKKTSARGLDPRRTAESVAQRTTPFHQWPFSGCPGTENTTGETRRNRSNQDFMAPQPPSPASSRWSRIPPLRFDIARKETQHELFVSNQNSSKKFVKLPESFTIKRAASAPFTARWS